MTNLNSILSRWQQDTVKTVPDLDCRSCAKRWKCCDFQPFWANFLIGAHIESDADLMFDSAHHWQPLGLIPDHGFREKHARTPPEQKDQDQVCLFFNPTQRQCQIWNTRPGECSNYFCEGMGEELQIASKQAFDLETIVAQKALIELGFTYTQVSEQVDLLNEPGRIFPAYAPNQLSDIYRQCWRWARNLTANEVREWL